ncbi:MAG: hypothetical protein ACM3UL_04840 [Ignavibacteria bacterium]
MAVMNASKIQFTVASSLILAAIGMMVGWIIDVFGAIGVWVGVGIIVLVWFVSS